ncbi:MAG: hypothetical protein SV253_08725 [Halobacteria archaeon]|nr:hypothetical protein [Halobacteria archaeon]
MNDLPTSVALETIPVSQGVRKGATVELDRDYFEGQRGAIGRTYDEKAANMSDRLQGLRESYDTVVNVKVRIGGIDTETLTEASEELRQKFEETYEAEFLDDNTPDDVEVFVVPEWVRRRGGLSYTARAYFFRDDETVSPDGIIQKNVESVVSEDGGFEKYRQSVLGYPDCPDDEDADSQDVTEIDGFEVREDEIGDNVDDIVPYIFDSDYAYMYFSSGFSTTETCDEAMSLGREVYRCLREEVKEGLVRDFFRMNYLRSWVERRGERDRGEDLAREEKYLRLPLGELVEGTSYV